MYVHTYIRTYINTYIHMYVHTYVIHTYYVRKYVHAYVRTYRHMHHLYITDALNGNQCGFTPQKNTEDAAMDVRQFIEPHLERGGGGWQYN